MQQTELATVTELGEIGKAEAFSEEELKKIKEMFDLFTSAYAKVAVPFLVFDRKEVKQKFLKSKKLLEEVVSSG
jgi:hypothetical protein